MEHELGASSPATPPGWYHAAGDPTGTHRYWDGDAWQGLPQPIATQPAAIPSSGVTGRPSAPPAFWPPWLSPIVWVVTVAKLLPLAGAALLGVLVLALSSQTVDQTGRNAELERFDFLPAVLGAVAVGILLVVAVGSVLVFGQLLMFRAKKALGLLIWAGLMGVLDALIVLGQIRSFPVLTMIVCAGQVFIAVGAWQALEASRAS